MKEVLDMNRIPQHIAIIMDGNGRWAMDRGLDRTFGHKAGLDNLEQVTTVCSNLGVKYLTVYAFSIENFNRPAYEVEALMGLVLSFFKMQLFQRAGQVALDGRRDCNVRWYGNDHCNALFFEARAGERFKDHRPQGAERRNEH